MVPLGTVIAGLGATLVGVQATTAVMAAGLVLLALTVDQDGPRRPQPGVALAPRPHIAMVAQQPPNATGIRCVYPSHHSGTHCRGRPDVRSLVLDVVKDLGTRRLRRERSRGARSVQPLRRRRHRQRLDDAAYGRRRAVPLSAVAVRRPVHVLHPADRARRLRAPHRRDAAGADDYLPKPFSLSDIEARLIAAERVTVVHRRREALLRQARRFAAETDPSRLLDNC